MRHRQEIAWTIVVGCVAVFVGFVVWAEGKRADKEKLLDPSCYETHPDVDVRRTLLSVVQGPNNGRSGLYACGLYSRPALPDVIRCYELSRGCSK